MKEKKLKQNLENQKKRRDKLWRRMVILTASTTAVTVILLSTGGRFLPVSGSEAVIPESRVQADQGYQSNEFIDNETQGEETQSKESQLIESQVKEPQVNEPQVEELQVEEPQVNESQVKEPQIKVEVDTAAEENEQKSVDEGHSPWKLDPVFVAQVFASLLLSPDGIVGDYPIAYKDITIIENNGTDAIAEIIDDKSIAKYVYLKRLIRQDDTGIWSVTGYDTAE